jgi:hypothetical protein
MKVSEKRRREGRKQGKLTETSIKTLFLSLVGGGDLRRTECVRSCLNESDIPKVYSPQAIPFLRCC